MKKLTKYATRKDELYNEWLKFHKKHPEVWELFCRFTFQKIRQGFKHYSAYAVVDRIRWETDRPDYDGKSEFKINNNHRPFYSRLFMEEYPEHKGFFRTRKQISEVWRPVNMPPLTPGYFER